MLIRKRQRISDGHCLVNKVYVAPTQPKALTDTQSRKQQKLYDGVDRAVLARCGNQLLALFLIQIFYLFGFGRIFLIKSATARIFLNVALSDTIGKNAGHYGFELQRLY